jgi:hypothetical protein
MKKSELKELVKQELQSYVTEATAVACQVWFQGTGWKNIMWVKSPKTNKIIKFTTNDTWANLSDGLTRKFKDIERHWKGARVDSFPSGESYSVKFTIPELKEIVDIWKSQGKKSS